MRQNENPHRGTGEWTVVTHLEELTELTTSLFYPTSYHLAREADGLRMRRRVAHTNTLVVGDVTHLTALETRSVSPAPSESFHVDLCLTGLASTVSERGRYVLSPGGGVVHNPGMTRSTTQWTEGTRLLMVKIDHDAVETALTRLLGRPPHSGLLMGSGIDTSVGSGRDWAKLVRMVTELVGTDDGLLQQPLALRPLQESLVNGFLLATSHSVSEELRAPEVARPRTLKAAIDMIEGQPELPLTVGEIADQVHVSVRALQNSFRQYLNTSPMKYLQIVRIRRAHAELLEADPADSSVSEIAYHWGFTHLSRFAQKYRVAYGVNPSMTLQSTR